MFDPEQLKFVGVGAATEFDADLIAKYGLSPGRLYELKTLYANGEADGLQDMDADQLRKWWKDQVMPNIGAYGLVQGSLVGLSTLGQEPESPAELDTIATRLLDESGREVYELTPTGIEIIQLVSKSYTLKEKL